MVRRTDDPDTVVMVRMEGGVKWRRVIVRGSTHITRAHGVSLHLTDSILQTIYHTIPATASLQTPMVPSKVEKISTQVVLSVLIKFLCFVWFYYGVLGSRLSMVLQVIHGNWLYMMLLLVRTVNKYHGRCIGRNSFELLLL